MEPRSRFIEAPPRSLARVERGALRPYVETPSDSFGNESEWTRIADLYRMAGRRKGILLGCLVLGLVGAAGVTHFTTPTYRASTSLEVQGINEDFLDLHQIDPAARATTFSAESYIQTQADILQDDAVLERVNRRLHLDTLPVFQGKPGLSARIAGYFPLTAPGTRAPERTIDRLREKLAVAPSPHSRLIRITYESEDPKLAADVVNTLADEFIGYNLEARLSAANQIGQWLGPQLDEMKQRLERSEADLSATSLAAGMPLTSGTETVAEQRLRDVQSELAAAQADRIAKESIYRIVAQSSPEALPPAMETTSLKAERDKLTDLRREKAELSALYTDSNYRVARVQAQIDELEQAVQREVQAIPGKARSEYQAALGREMMLAKAYNAQAATVSRQANERIRYESLKRAVDDNRQIYQATLQKVKEAGIASAIKPSGVRVIGAATVPVKPYRPSPPLNLALGLTAGLCAGLLGVSVVERTKRVIRAPGELQAWLNVPELGAIPNANPDSLYSTPKRLLLDRKPEVHLELATWEQKHSAVSESFREVLASLVYSGAVKSLLVSSAAPMEGKTTVVSNLAITLAGIGKRVLLIDGDLRKPRLHQIFGQPNTWGLSDVLGDKRSVSELPVAELAKETNIPGLYLLPSGPSTEEITTLLYSSRMQDLMNRFRKDFDYVVLDAPPVLRFSDARILGHAADAVVLVARANRTAPENIREAAARFRMVGIPVLGTILNDCDHRAMDKYGYKYQA